MRYLFYILTLSTLLVNSQTVTPQVINSAGKHYTTAVNGIYITDNIGEPFTQTQGPNNNILLTEGFLQPFYFSPLIAGNIIKNNLSCSDKNDGKIKIELNTSLTNYSVKYIWTPNSVCPDSTCAEVDSLKAGNYNIKIQIKYAYNGIAKTDTLNQFNETIEDLNGPCKIKIYTGVSLNADGINDQWVIDNIEEFPNNKIQIYTRWGKQVFNTENYKNGVNAWPEKDNSKSYTSGTYFYVIDLGDGSAVLKGWLELINN
ncbi:MAG: gliding motility-associated C-terminal domain-containing protein [Sphingobacteriaceae bacterium]|nr:gliding motility-associated C-terminal domain-containing protein [Sphingobacteriaceae bacterium]